MENHVSIEEAYVLPGYSLYDHDVMEKDFRIRAMTTKEEKIRLSSPGLGTLARVIQSCLINNKNIDIRDLKLFDFQYLMYKTRIVTYGEQYRITIKCPYCGREADHSINLDKLNITEVPVDFKEPFTIGPLPKSQDVLECKMFSVRDVIDLDNESEEFIKKFPEYDGDPSFILDLCKRIVSVNGQMPLDLRGYVENLHALDYQYFSTKYAELTNSFGIDSRVELECPHCKKKRLLELPMTSEFFRPSYFD